MPQAEKTGQETAPTLDVLVAHSKAFFALVSENPNYPKARRKFALEIAHYIRDETKRVSENRLFKTATDQKLYKKSRLGYGRATDKLLDNPSPSNTELEIIVGRDANENLEFGKYVCSSYDAMASMFRKLIEMEAVSDGTTEGLDAGYLQAAYRYLDIAAHAFLGSAHRALYGDADDRGKLYAEMNADFQGKLDEYRKAIGEKTRMMDALHVTSDELCKKSTKVTKREFESVLKRKTDEMMQKPAISIYG